MCAGSSCCASLACRCASTGAVPRPFPARRIEPPAPRPRRHPGAAAAALIARSLRCGTPYRNGGSDPAGFDCSGFMQYMFGQSRPRAAARGRASSLRRRARRTPDDLAPGDLVFFAIDGRSASRTSASPSARDEFVHAPSSTGVVRVEQR